MTNALAIIPTYLRTKDDVAVVETCIRTLKETAPGLEIMMIDDGSPFKGAQDIGGADTTLLLTENGGFAKAVNYGLVRAHEEHRDAILVNADIEFVDGTWLSAMEASSADIVGALLLYPTEPGWVQHAGVHYSWLTRGWDHRLKHAPIDLPAVKESVDCPVTAALQYIHWNVLDTIDFYDEDFPLAFEDVDYCIRAEDAGFVCRYEPSVVAVHHESAFRGDGAMGDKEQASWLHFCEKYNGVDFKRLSL